MTVEEGLALIEQILPQGRLSKVQTIVFRQAWEGQSYKEIADQFDYTLGYIKDTGAGLWKLLSKALGEDVTRRNFQVVLKRAVRQKAEDTEINSKFKIQNSLPTPHTPHPIKTGELRSMFPSSTTAPLNWRLWSNGWNRIDAAR